MEKYKAGLVSGTIYRNCRDWRVSCVLESGTRVIANDVGTTEHMREGERLYWDSSYAVALKLMEAHPDAQLCDVTLGILYDWVVALPDFSDDPALANDELLNAILQEWLEETLSHD